MDPVLKTKGLAHKVAPWKASMFGHIWEMGPTTALRLVLGGGINASPFSLSGKLQESFWLLTFFDFWNILIYKVAV